MFVVGLATNYCCKFTALDAKLDGFVTTLLLPLTCGVSHDGSAFDPSGTIQQLEDKGVRVERNIDALLQR